MAAPAGQGPGPNTDIFNSYFHRADLDRDGRISGSEAVAFFQGSSLPKQVLAQIWTYADQNRTGFLGRPEFYNALKLVTVAQSGRQLTPEIVKAALYGPAAAKIPAPQINPLSSPAAQMNPVGTSTPHLNSMASPSSQMGVVAPTASQNPGFRGPQENTSLGMNRQFFPSPDNHFMRPSQATPSASLSMQGVGQGLSGAGSMTGPHPLGLPGAGSMSGPLPQGPPGTGSVTGPRPPISNSPNLSTDWFSGRTTGASVGGISQDSVRGVISANQDRFGIVMPGTSSGVTTKPQTISSPGSSLPPKPLDQALYSSQPAANTSRELAISGNGFSSNSGFGGDVFATNSQSKPDASTPSFPVRSMTNTSVTASVATDSQNSTKNGQPHALPSSSILSQGAGQLQQTTSLVKQNLDLLQSTSAITTSNVSVGPGAPASNQSQPPWPRITQSNIQKYTNVFLEVDKDRDGKITGDQARNLFLSWKLPREVLKQVWDLSDQDNDSMLSLREFCIALYLMERFREGHPLPAVLPNTVKFDETLLRATPQPSTSYSGQTWKPNPGLSQQGISGSRPPLPVSGIRPPMHSPIPFQMDGSGHIVQQRSRGPTLDNHLTNQLGNGEQSALNSNFQEATDPDKNVKELEKQILDSREKVEFYRTKMQELVLYKSRCDNRLNEITERALADKREAESLAKRYEEKYKQVGEIASKLTVEEAAYRHVQERKLELQNAIVKMEQGGSADGLLQVRADRIQSDLEELMKALNDRCKHHGLNVKPSAMIELPFGWQPGIQEGALEWNEDWDKFEDEGFSIVKELTVNVDNAVAPAKPTSPSYWSDKGSGDEFSPVTSSKMANKKNRLSIADQITETESAYDPSEDGLARSSPGSPDRNVFESPSQEFHGTQFGIHNVSPRAKGNHSDHGGVESTISGDKFADEPSWNFDGNDDVDSVWGFDTTNTKEADYETSKNNSLFSSGDYGLNPIKVDSPSAGSTFGKEKKNSFFDDSVPSTPLFSSGASPKFNDGPEDHSFNTFNRFDSFSTNDGGFFTQRESFSRFDSIRSTADFEHSQGGSLARFDSMRSTVDFDHRQGENLARFDSMRSTTDFDHSRAFPSFDDADPFGSTGPFKSSDSHSPRKGSDSWSAF